MTVTPASAPAAPRARLAWPDVGRGLSILGVVLLHASTSIPGGTETFIQPLNDVLTPLRLPLFFLISGYFSAKVLRQSLSSLAARRLWFFLVPYVVWASVDIVQSAAASTIAHGADPLTWEAYGDRLTQGVTIYWFFQMLIVCNLWLWATRRLGTVAAFAVTFAPLLLLAQQQMVPDWQFRIMVYVPIFMIGARARQLVAQVARAAANPVVGGGLLVAGVLIELRYRVFRAELAEGAFAEPRVFSAAGWQFVFDRNDLVIGVELVYRLALIPVAVALAVVLSRVPGVSQAVQLLGRNTLVLYIGHPLGMFVFLHLFTLRGVDFAAHLNGWFLLQFLFCAVGCAVAWAASRTPYVQWLLTPPQLVRRQARATSATLRDTTPAATGRG
ncbi:hypothetical protein C1Y63_07725 [Corynebacterium sp. 13CS0277]|uniref:acyltransferase family protein n=1 Tax=Corynebacterium sp. 13CS0277 TaxID=2071994 RepID=UPI000D039C34|nr:acyltransferase family protein [Corynebacterium sp. 13CS0277]PRQ11136.1 hypothetical protein C1Y63_07725 [Corynebacterium sp. 13CS0277]